jgi:hypothetical protein
VLGLTENICEERIRGVMHSKVFLEEEQIIHVVDNAVEE